MADKLSKSLRELRNSTEELNVLTDKANDLVRRTERFLIDECRVGGPVYVHVKSMDETTEMPNGQLGPDWSTYLGFERYKGEHRIVVSHLLDSDPHEEKPWAECNRDIKLQTLKALPDLIEELLKKVKSQVSGLQVTVSALDSMLPPDDEPNKRGTRGGRG